MKNSLCVRRYTFKLYPKKEQERVLVRQAALLAQLWNAALEQREIQWAHECQRSAKGERKGLSKFDQQRELKQIRNENPEYKAIGQDTKALCLTALDDAFMAFFKRAKGGAGKSSGYPRYKSVYGIENKGRDCTIWHRDHGKGWRMVQDGKNFRIYAIGMGNVRDQSTWMKARGKFPVDFDKVEIRDMRLIRVGGEWFASIVVRMEARRAKDATAPSAVVKFDLIDEFVSVETGTNGECLAGWEGDYSSSDEQISPDNQGLNGAPGAEASDSGSDDRLSIAASMRSHGAEASERLSAQQETDAVQSEGDRRFKKFSYRWRQWKRRVAKRKSKEARQRKEALHRWTTELVEAASDLTVVCPPIKDSTRSAKGNERNHGAAVKTVAMLNRHVLAHAPAMSIQMLEYKAEEAGVPFVTVSPDEHALAIGRELPAAAKAVRRLRHQLKHGEV